MQSEKEKERKKKKKYDSYEKPANLTPALLWPSTAIRFQTRDKWKNRAPTTLPSKSTCQSLSGRKNCLYLAGVLLKPVYSRHSGLEVSYIIWYSYSMDTSTTTLRVRLEAFEQKHTTKIRQLCFPREWVIFYSLSPSHSRSPSQEPASNRNILKGISHAREATSSPHCSSPTQSLSESQHSDWLNHKPLDRGGWTNLGQRLETKISHLLSQVFKSSLLIFKISSSFWCSQWILNFVLKNDEINHIPLFFYSFFFFSVQNCSKIFHWNMQSFACPKHAVFTD